MAKQARAIKDEQPVDGNQASEATSTATTGDAREMEARGRMLTEYGELRRHLAELMAKSSSLGAEFRELSDQLRMCPNVVSIEGLIPSNSDKPVFGPALFETDALVSLVSDIRETIARKNEIQERLQDLGILDAYGQFRY